MTCRGKFTRSHQDPYIFKLMDSTDDASRLQPDNTLYIYKASGRYLSFPRQSLCYEKDMVIDLAMYGFIWCNDGSRLGYVKCVYCGFQIEDYNEAKLAGIEHFKGSPDCPLMKMQASKELSGDNPTNPGPLSQRQAFIPPDVLHTVTNVKHPLVESSSINLSPLGKIEPEHQREKESERKRSLYPSYPSYHMIPNDLQRYGFYWVGGDNDLMMCKTCGLNIKNWQRGDLAAIVHSVFSPECSFMKGLYSIKNIYIQYD